MDPDTTTAVEDAYGLAIRRATPGARGWVGENYVLETAAGRTCFLKLIADPRYSQQPKQGLALLRQLREKGFESASYPLATRDGGLFLEWDGRLAILFELISGRQTYEYDRAEVGALTARLHRLTAGLSAPLERETYGPGRSADLLPLLDRALDEPPPNPVAAEMQPFLRPRRAMLAEDWQRYLAAGRECRRSGLPLVVTHGDIPYNVMKDDEGRLHLVDWDEALLAPAERDTWFYAAEPAFLAGYRRVVPDYRMDQAAFRFYLFIRYWEDVLGFVEVILGDGPEAEQRRWLEALRTYILGEGGLREQAAADWSG